MKKVTSNNGFFIIVNTVYGCYVDRDFNFRRSVEDLDAEIAWAKEKWQKYEEASLSTDEEKILLNQLQYVSEYKQSLETI